MGTQLQRLQNNQTEQAKKRQPTQSRISWHFYNLESKTLPVKDFLDLLSENQSYMNPLHQKGFSKKSNFAMRIMKRMKKKHYFCKKH